MSLTEARFHQLIDAAQRAVEDAFDASELDVDLENSGGVLTVRFDNGSQLILSRQEPLRQLWVAARSGGFHLDHSDTGWHCAATSETLPQLLARATREQGGEDVDFSDV